MRRVFLIRHGHPDFPLGAHMCLGRTDTPLGPLGRMQSRLLGEVLGSKNLTVFSSPLRRCRETATPLKEEIQLVPELSEQDMGPWDGLDFDRIRQYWPKLYARRGKEPLLVPPGAETLISVQERVLPAFDACIRKCEGELAIVAHASVIQAILASVLRIPLEESRPLRPPYGSYAVLLYDGCLHVEKNALLPSLYLTPQLAQALLQAADPGERVVVHCRAVAAEALRIADALPLGLDRQLLECAALLHDVARNENDHARLGAAWLRELGYGSTADIVEQHHDLESESIDEAAVLFLADKCVREDRRVSLETRFRESKKRCATPEALAAHTRRRDTALRIRDEVNALCGYVLIE